MEKNERMAIVKRLKKLTKFIESSKDPIIFQLNAETYNVNNTNGIGVQRTVYNGWKELNLKYYDSNMSGFRDFSSDLTKKL